MPFLATIPITMIIPMNDDTLNVVRVISRAMKHAGCRKKRRRENRQRRRERAKFKQAAR